MHLLKGFSLREALFKTSGWFYENSSSLGQNSKIRFLQRLWAFQRPRCKGHIKKSSFERNKNP